MDLQMVNAAAVIGRTGVQVEPFRAKHADRIDPAQWPIGPGG